jgi:hypothetical protein
MAESIMLLPPYLKDVLLQTSMTLATRHKTEKAPPRGARERLHSIFVLNRDKVGMACFLPRSLLAPQHH